MDPNQMIEQQHTPQEVAKPAEATKESSVQQRFEKAKGRFGSIASSIQQAFGKLKTQAPQINFVPEQDELGQSLEQLDELNQTTQHQLGRSPNPQEAQPNTEAEASVYPMSKAESNSSYNFFDGIHNNLDSLLKQGVDSPETSRQIISLTNDFFSKKADFQRLFHQEKIPTIAIDTLSKIFQVYSGNAWSAETNTSLKESFDKFKEFSLPFIHSNINNLEAKASLRKGVQHIQPEMRLVSYLAEFGAGAQKRDAVDFLLRNFGKVSSEFKKEDESLYRSPDLLVSLDALLKNSDPKQFERVMKLMDETNEPEIKTLALNELPVCIRERQAKEILSKYNLDPDKTLSSWRLSTDHMQQALDINIARIVSLEQERPGISSILNNEFGINNFGRYPKDMLVAQYDQRENSALPYGAIVYPYSDGSGAFYGDVKVFEKLLRQTKDKYGIRVFEVKSPLEMIKAFNGSRKKFGPISFAIIGGHGTTNTIRLNDASSTDFLSSEQIVRKGASALSLAFVENPTIILNSCSTGQLGGIGEEISKLGARVVGPEEPSYITDISVDLSAGRIKLDAKYKVNRDYSTSNRHVKANTFSS